MLELSNSPHSGSSVSLIATWASSGEMVIGAVPLSRDILTEKLSSVISHISSFLIDSVTV